ncbi:MAG: nucleotidyltransferase domain-containing protein [Pseudanabaena sp.]|uniref:nucleotidyltransferase domain-containing protein n=1 Tax=unclassified Microcystis TaxID=2643300 RepID=UPI0025891260|nr:MULTISPECIES: nucleotidyltransferase domain-containing protein [unclassified Microcystis]
MARGEASEDSDIDILVVLRDLVLPMSEIRRMADIKLDFLLEFGELLSIMPMSLDEFNDNSASLSVYGGEDVNQPTIINKRREKIWSILRSMRYSNRCPSKLD